MQLVEQHIIERPDSRFTVIDPACFASKNLYNAALTILRQSFLVHARVPTYAKLAHMLKVTPEFRALPAKLAQWAVRQVCVAWDTFRKAQTAYQQCPGEFISAQGQPIHADINGSYNYARQSHRL